MSICPQCSHNNKKQNNVCIRCGASIALLTSPQTTTPRRKTVELSVGFLSQKHTRTVAEKDVLLLNKKEAGRPVSTEQISPVASNAEIPRIPTQHLKDQAKTTLALEGTIQSTSSQTSTVSSKPLKTIAESSKPLKTIAEPSEPLKTINESTQPPSEIAAHSFAHPQNNAAPIAEKKDPLLGQKLGNYLLEKKIGKGGFGSVYRAKHLFIPQLFAIKILHVDRQTDPEIVERFKREANALAQLRHKSIVQMADFGMLPDIGFYLAMEYLEGRNLQGVLKRGYQFSASQIICMIEQLCDVLEYVHTNGIVHRDLKPANVFVLKASTEEAPQIRLLDFGIATASADHAALTGTGTYLGTAKYISPEQGRGDRHIDGRADLYSLGIILYRLLTQVLPFDAPQPLTILYNQLHLMPPRLQEQKPNQSWAPELEQFIQKALAKDPNHRPQTAQAFKQECVRALSAQHALESSSQPKKAYALPQDQAHPMKQSSDSTSFPSPPGTSSGSLGPLVPLRPVAPLHPHVRLPLTQQSTLAPGDSNTTIPMDAIQQVRFSSLHEPSSLESESLFDGLEPHYIDSSRNLDAKARTTRWFLLLCITGVLLFGWWQWSRSTSNTHPDVSGAIRSKRPSPRQPMTRQKSSVGQKPDERQGVQSTSKHPADVNGTQVPTQPDSTSRSKRPLKSSMNKKRKRYKRRNFKYTRKHPKHRTQPKAP